MKHPPVAIVVAMAGNRVIGRNGGLPWRLPADMSRFRALTMGKPIVMGRRTHESIGRALDGRRNIVVSRRPDYRAPGCTVAPSFEAALEAASGAAEVAVVGGAGIYEQALPVAARIHLTLVHARVDGDVRFPRIDPAAWREVSRTERRADARNRHDVSFIELVADRGTGPEPGDDILGTCYATTPATGDRTSSDRFPDSFVIPGNPSTEQSDPFPWGSRDGM